jgi:serine/threonine protein kinase
MAELNHENIVQFIGICMNDGRSHIVTIWRPHGSLDEFLQKHYIHLKPVHLLTYCQQIASVNFL